MSNYPKVSGKFTKRLKNSKLKSRIKVFLITLGVVLLIFYFFWGEFGFFRMWILKHKIDKLESELISLKVEKQDLLWEIDKIKNDADYIKKYAVKEYGYARPDQSIIQFVPKDTSKTEKDNLPDNPQKK